MNSYQFFMPTLVISGPDIFESARPYFSLFGKKAFIMTGPSSAEKCGVLRDCLKILEQEGILYRHWNKVRPNPTVEEAREAARSARDFSADFIIALGGGSPMDAAKAAAILSGSDLTDDQLFSLKQFPRVLPVIAVPTTAGTGSEVTPYSVLTNRKENTKTSISSPQIYPRLALLNAEYTRDLPFDITAATAADAVSHSIEGYLSRRSAPVVRCLALESLRQAASPLAKLYSRETLSVPDREALLYASMLAGVVIAQTGTVLVHAMGYSLTYFKNIDHGRGNGLLLGPFLDYTAVSRPEDVRNLLSALGAENTEDFKKLMNGILEPVHLTGKEISQFVGQVLETRNVANTDPVPTKEDIESLYERL